MGKKLLYFAWIIAFLVVLKTSSSVVKEETTEFQGIAETREVIVNSENSVEIRVVHVVPGQEIQKGRLLVELERPELTMKLNEIDRQLAELESRDGVSKDEIKYQISQLMADQKVRMSEINHKIEQANSRYTFNKEIVSNLKSIDNSYGDIEDGSDATKKYSKTSGLKIEIANLTQERDLTEKLFQTEINNLKTKLASSATVETIRQERLKKELSLLEEDKKSLLIHASMDGMIGSISCKAGEMVSPFQTILTLHTHSPSYVRGYIHENIHNLASTGDTVQVVALTGDRTPVEGEIVGVGSRIIDYPLRLKKRAGMQLWGREVEIHLPANNSFLLGEKVTIRTANYVDKNYLAWIQKWFVHDSYASEAEEEAKETTIPITGADLEASGLIYLKDLDRHLVISGDTKGMKNTLYLMDDKARISSELQIEGLGKIDSMESICQDESGHIYLTCSIGHKESGALSDEQKLFVRINRSGTKLVVDGQVLLSDLLIDAALNNPDEAWTTFIGKANRNIEIEGMFVEKNELFLGLKNTLKQNRAVVFKIGDLAQMLDNNRLEKAQVQIWKNLDLRNQGDKNTLAGVIDLYRYQDTLLVLSTSHHVQDEENASSEPETTGVLRVFDIKKGNLISTQHFDHLSPEGIAYDSLRDRFVITFDQGSDAPSMMLKLQSISRSNPLS